MISQTAIKMNTIRPQQIDEPASKWRSLAATCSNQEHTDTEVASGTVGVVGGSMTGKGGAVNTGDLSGQDVERRQAGVRSVIVAQAGLETKHGGTTSTQEQRRVTTAGAKDGRKADQTDKTPNEDQPTGVPATDKQEGEDLWQRHRAERGVWSQKMLEALDTGVRGKKWFSLIDKIYAERTLQLAWAKVQDNAGGCGVDGITVGHFGKDSQKRLLAVKEQVQRGTYQPKPIKRVWIPKLGSSEKRPLGIPTVTDRVVQAATRMVIEPIFEREFAPHSYGFRPGRGCKDALRRVEELLQSGHIHIVDVDIKGYFDSIPHDLLMKQVREHIADGRVLKLIEGFLKQGVMTQMGKMESHEAEDGTPQGGVISPLLANIYLNPLDWQTSQKGREMVRYADDMVILCQSAEAAQQALQDLREWANQAGLTLHPEKTKIVDMGQPKANFEFLGYQFWRSKTSGQIRRFIREKSLKKLRAEIKPLTKRANGHSLEAIVARLRPKLKGFYNYFKHASASALENVDGWIRGRLRGILRKRAGRRGRGRGRDHQRWNNHYFAQLGLFSLKQALELEKSSLRKADNC